jgi:hypothetical protein
MTPETLTDVLEDLLTKAEQSHLAHQQEHGDTEWPPYYAEYLHRALGADYTLEQVTASLREAAVAHARHEEESGGARDEQWPRWYAEHMSGSLSREWYQWLAETGSWEI